MYILAFCYLWKYPNERKIYLKYLFQTFQTFKKTNLNIAKVTNIRLYANVTRNTKSNAFVTILSIKTKKFYL